VFREQQPDGQMRPEARQIHGLLLALPRRRCSQRRQCCGCQRQDKANHPICRLVPYRFQGMSSDVIAAVNDSSVSVMSLPRLCPAVIWPRCLDPCACCPTPLREYMIGAGLLISSIATAWARLDNKFDLLYSKRAFVHWVSRLYFPH
jgi:hypothetical protein